MPNAPLALRDECFFVAPIGEEGDEVRRRSDGVLRFIVARAAGEMGLTAVRADQIAAPGQITLQVIDHILGARAAVADLTGRNPNVFYELAVRHTARLPVALIVARDDPPLPFDIAQMRTIRFDHTDLESADQCRQAIVAHLREALEGAVDSPVATSVDLRALQSGNKVERNIAELITNVEELARMQGTTSRMLGRLSEELLDHQAAAPDMGDTLVAASLELLDLGDMLKRRNDEELAGRVETLAERLDELDNRLHQRWRRRYVAREAELVKKPDALAREAKMRAIRERDRLTRMRREREEEVAGAASSNSNDEM